MIAKRTKQKITFLVEVHLQNVFGFFVQCSHNTKKKRKKKKLNC